MRRLSYTAQANFDFEDIAIYISDASGSDAVAESFTGELKLHCEKLASLPGTLGRARPELRPEIRSIPHGQYLIFFRYLDDVLEVVTVVHGNRDLEAHFDDIDDLP